MFNVHDRPSLIVNRFRNCTTARCMQKLFYAPTYSARKPIILYRRIGQRLTQPCSRLHSYIDAVQTHRHQDMFLKCFKYVEKKRQEKRNNQSITKLVYSFSKGYQTNHNRTCVVRNRPNIMARGDRHFSRACQLRTFPLGPFPPPGRFPLLFECLGRFPLGQ